MSAQIDVLDHGFVRLVDHYGSDSRIVQAARVSYGAGTKTVREDSKLIHYLMRNRHMSPFEMVDFIFHIKAPIFIARQWFRHRTASVNEISARYSVMADQFYVPEVARKQSATNKQSSGEHVDDPQRCEDLYQQAYSAAYSAYTALLEEGVSREQARLVLPVGLYTEFYWKQNLRNLLHLLHLRLDSHAQDEAQQYAQAVLTLIEPIAPVTVEAWRQYVAK